MRKFQQQQILDVIQSLHRLHGQIKDRLNSKEYETVQTALANCQEVAIQVGEAIEQLEGTGTQVVSYLEQYCENIYQTSTQLQETSPQKAYKSLESNLIKAENDVKHMQARTEVVFLPYNVSMWDSLESVWKAADEDPNCDAYVIPIPYYDKNSDGSIKEMHYEGDQYPEYVPITNYEKYDFDGRKPDMIFIHNPYDEFNLVTSVHPFFYTKNLKKFTDMLVYIPYFVLSEISPDNEQAVKGMEHFCTVPGVFYSDRVIVQSEDMRTIYINVLTETFGEGTRQTWEQKILGLGSPKFDRVSSTNKDGIEIPEDWLRIIQKPDGSYKKIIFYNTSINALLKREDEMLIKMQDVFAIFKENKDNVALLWRPHPLIKSTISSMRPKLWEAYEKIAERYIKEGWGIYDDTADLNRAIALSDVYYGDASSVVQLCRKVGMPVMIQKVKVLSGEIDRSLQFFDAHIDEEYLYFSARNFNGLFRVEIGKTEAEFLGHFIGEELWRRDLHRQVFCVGNRLFFIPRQGDGISIYNKETKEFSFVALEEIEQIFIVRAFLIHNDIYMMQVGLERPFILFHTENNRYEILDELCENIRLQLQNPDKVFWGVYGMCIVNRNMFLKGDDGVILCVDLESWKVHSYKLPKAYIIHNLYYDGKEFYFTLRDKCWVIKWDPDTGRCHEYKIADTQENCTPPYMTLLRWQGHLLLLPNREKDIFELDEKKNEWFVKTDYIPKGFHRKEEGDSLFLGYQFTGDNLLLLPYTGNGMIIFSKDESRMCEILYPETLTEKIIEYKEKCIKDRAAQENILHEDDEIGSNLCHILSILPSTLHGDDMPDMQIIGKYIWDCCK